MKVCKIGILLCAISVLLSGCWSTIELNDRTFVSGLFVDKSPVPGEVLLTIATPLTNRMTSGAEAGGPSSSGNPYATVTKSGKTFPEAMLRIQDDLTRKLTWGQTRIIVMGREYAEQGTKELFEWLIRQPQFHLKTYIIVAPGKATEITELTPVYERTPTEVLREFVNLKVLMQTSVKNYLEAVIAGQDVAASILTFGKVEAVSEKGKETPWAGTDGAALFRDGKLVGTLNMEETKVLSWLNKSHQSQIRTVELDGAKEKISVTMRQLKRQIRPQLSGNKIVFHITLTAEADVLSAVSSKDLLDPKVVHKIEQKFADDVRTDALAMLKKTQRLKSDILMLGSIVDWRYPRKWREIRDDWRDYYRDNVDFQIQANIRIMHFGAETVPFWQDRK
ncbi:Spore germination protein B3 [Paenibacillus sp. CECT 9249]|uniref:Ger(x)C family spore germination protein n=1 Tax=Paenibacillus sp. CECT 9249 TaxID=2845385 RepID=UPI001E42F0DF|nr:Ger(x)C family spore germination protein [Paenibacillus sp. CECT 9249]CAH0119075.1 Spore germination protein B3 [Paenibacillus sp. CECT 9249]